MACSWLSQLDAPIALWKLAEVKTCKKAVQILIKWACLLDTIFFIIDAIIVTSDIIVFIDMS